MSLSQGKEAEIVRIRATVTAAADEETARLRSETEQAHAASALVTAQVAKLQRQRKGQTDRSQNSLKSPDLIEITLSFKLCEVD